MMANHRLNFVVPAAALLLASGASYAQYQVIEIARQGAGPAGAYDSLGLPSISDTGRIAFTSTVDYGADGTATVVFRHDGITSTDAEPLYSSAASGAGACTNSGGAICLDFGIGQVAIVNDNDEVAFEVGPQGFPVNSTDIVSGDGLASPTVRLSNAYVDVDNDFNFFQNNPLQFGAFNDNDYVAAMMGGACNGADNTGAIINDGTGISNQKPLGDPDDTVPPGLLVGQECGVTPNGYFVGTDDVAITANAQRIATFGLDISLIDQNESPNGWGVYLADPASGPDATRIAPVFTTANQHIDINAASQVVYTDDRTDFSNNLQTDQRLFFLDTAGTGGPTELLAVGANHPDYNYIFDVAIIDTGEVYALVDLKIGQFTIIKIDPASPTPEEIPLRGRQFSGSQIFRVEWARDGVNNNGDIAARVQIFSGEWLIVVAVPDVPAPDIRVEDSTIPVTDLFVNFGSLAPGSTSQATFTVSNEGGGNLDISSVGVADPLAAPYAFLQDTCTGVTLTASSTPCEIVVEFAPTADGQFDETFDIVSNDPVDGSLTVSMSGSLNLPGSFNFEQASYQAGEGAGTLAVNVQRSSAVGAVTVDYATVDQEAQGGADYTTTTGTLPFADGETQQTISVPILDDAQVENTETFLLQLSNPTGGAVIGAIGETTITINDNDILVADLNVTGMDVARAERDGAGGSNAFIDYAITVSNEGTATASNTQVTLAFDAAELAWQSDDANGSYDVNTSTWMVGDLLINNSQTLMITFMALAEGDIALSATATSDDSEPTPDPNPNTLDFTTTVGPDSDGDGVFDVDDNAPADYNPDQSDIDGDGVGDVSDLCPGDATDTCDPDRSAALNVDGTGGSLSTTDGAVSITIPAGALTDDTSMSITDLGSDFTLATDLGTTNAIFGVNIGPDGTTFAVPVTIVFTWVDANDDGTVDGTTIDEMTLQMFKDGVAISDTCANDAGCDAAANTFAVEVSSLSDFVLGAVAPTPPPPPPPPPPARRSGGGSPGILLLLLAGALCSRSLRGHPRRRARPMRSGGESAGVRR